MFPVPADASGIGVSIIQTFLGFLVTLFSCVILLLLTKGLIELWPKDSSEDIKKREKAAREKEILSDPNFDPLKIKKEDIEKPERQELNVAGKTFKINFDKF